MSFSVYGINFRSAPVEVREQVSFAPSAVPAMLQTIRCEFPDSAVVLLSTCNRTELYMAGPDLHDRRDRLMQILFGNADHATVSAAAKHVYSKTDIEATEHLFAVAAGLDSMVVGEAEILGQVKRAFAIGEEERTTNSLLSTVFQNAFKVAKAVHTHTDVSRGRVSVSSIAVAFAEKVFQDLGSKTVMIVGAGETAELTLKSLIERGARDLLVLNRSLENGRALAEPYGGQAIPFELLEDYLPRADIVISSTGAPHVVVQAESVRRAMKARLGKPVLLIDIAVPRDIDPAAGSVKNVYLYDIDDLQRVAEENMSRRQAAAGESWKIVKTMVSESAGLFADTGLRDMLRQFDDFGRQVRERALARTFARQTISDLPEASRDEVSKMALKIVNKMLQNPRDALKRAAADGNWDEYARVARDLFGFEETTDQDDGDLDTED